MQFDYENNTHETQTMASFQTGVECMPLIYVSPERDCFLEVRRKRWGAPRIKHLRRREALRYADVYHIDGLREILALSKAANDVANIANGLEDFIAGMKRGEGTMEGQCAVGVRRVMESLGVICREQNEKAAELRWAHPFITALPYVGQVSRVVG